MKDVLLDMGLTSISSLRCPNKLCVFDIYIFIYIYNLELIISNYSKLTYIL